jgi:hypothetical protein
MDPLTISAISTGLSLATSYGQYRKGIKDAKSIDEMGLKSKEDATLPEFYKVEQRYKDIADNGLSEAETSNFIKNASAANYATQLNAKSMAGGSLARYTLALNNSNMVSALGNLTAQNFQRRLQGTQLYSGMLSKRQARIDSDIDTENQARLRAGAAASGLASQGGRNGVGALAAFGTAAMYMAGNGKAGSSAIDFSKLMDLIPKGAGGASDATSSSSATSSTPSAFSMSADYGDNWDFNGTPTNK